MFKVNGKDTKTTPLEATSFTSCSSVSIVNFGYAIVGWAIISFPLWVMLFENFKISSVMIRKCFLSPKLKVHSWIKSVPIKMAVFYTENVNCIMRKNISPLNNNLMIVSSLGHNLVLFKLPKNIFFKQNSLNFLNLNIVTVKIIQHSNATIRKDTKIVFLKLPLKYFWEHF